MADYEPRNFIQPCLLLLLRERSDHGYDLIVRLRELHAVDGEAGVVYRALRTLEKAGMVRSSWEASDAGPARRTYQVTPLGVATLDRQADILDDTHRTLHLFRQRYQQLSGCAGVRTAVGSGNGRAVSVVASGNGRAGSAAASGLDAGNGRAGKSVTEGNGAGERRNGDDGGTAGGSPGDSGGRGVPPPRTPGQRTGC